MEEEKKEFEEEIIKKEETISKEEYLKLKRSNEKKKATIVILIFGMILIVAVVVLFYLTLSKDEPKTNNGEGNNQQETNNDNGNGNNQQEKENDNEKEEATVVRNFDDVIKNYVDYNGKQSKYEMSKGKPNELSVDEGQYAVLSQDGKVSLKNSDNTTIEITNISNAIDIGFLYWPNFYILNANGELYWYDLTKQEKPEEALHKSELSINATNFVTITHCPTKDAGCNSYLGVIDNNNGYVEIANWGY